MGYDEGGMNLHMCVYTMYIHVHVKVQRVLILQLYKYMYMYPGANVRVRRGITRKLARSRHATPLFHELTRLHDEAQF